MNIAIENIRKKTSTIDTWKNKTDILKESSNSNETINKISAF